MPTDPPREPHGLLLAFAAACDPTGARSHDEHVRAALEMEREIHEQANTPSRKGEQ